MIIDAKIYNILIACPKDMIDEIDIIKDVFLFYNKTTGYTNYVHLKLEYWNYDSHPKNPQDNSYDFAIVLLGTKFERGVENFCEISKNVNIFFSDCPIAPSLIDVVQLWKVKEFEKEIKNNRDGFVETYASLKEFEKKLRIFLYNYMKDTYKCK